MIERMKSSLAARRAAHAMLRPRRLALEFERKRAAGWPGIALAAAGVLAALVVVSAYRDASARLEAWENKLAELERISRRHGSALTGTARDSVQARAEIRLANAVLQEMTLPWDRLFAKLERARSKEVALLSVQSDMQNRAVRIGGEAKDLRAAIEYSRRLESGGLLYNVYVVGHTMKTGNAQRPVGFSLTGSWR